MLDFFKKQSEKQENFWALLIEPEWISSCIWEIKDEKVEVLYTSPPTRWEEDLTRAVDTSLSACSQNLPEDTIDPTKTVFGVPNSWIENGNIKEEFLLKLKKICDDLSLVPSGFVVLSEAISHFIKQEEETPLTGIVIGISNEMFDLSMFSSGKLSGTTTVLRSVSIEDDIIEGISRLSSGVENLPSRIILFNQKEQELEEIKNSLDAADWKEVKFIHTPKIEILDPNKKILAVALAGGSEMGAVGGIAEKNGELETVTEEMPLEEINKFASYEVNNIEEPDGVTAEDLGFVQENPRQSVHIDLPKIPEIKFKKPTMPIIKLPKLNFTLGSKPLIIGGVGLLTLIITGFIMWWFLPKATVTIFVAPKKLEENISISLDSELNTNKIEVSVNGEKSKSTSGTKTVGEKAKGQVKIQNGTAFPINLTSGSILVSPSDLKFVTLSQASVSGALSPSNPGTATIQVEAASIGSEYNLNKDEVFKVSNYPKAEVDGTSVEGFSGGSSRQISSVSEEDRKSLNKELTNQLMNEAKTKLNNQITSSEYLIDSYTNSEVNDEDFSNKVGDEATTLKLKLDLKVSASTIAKVDLSRLAKETLKDKIPEGFVLRDDQLDYEFLPSDKGFEVKVIANLLPSNDPIEIAKKIAGRYPNLAESYFSSVPGFVRAEFKFKMLLPGKLGTLPHISKNISVEFSADK